ncbi:toll/interleukin-1 receptor domain-containing protein [Bacillus sp. CDB3]|uniref:toll/interleukin-1 receptor domain-containing protein n=1 Tax=Bacillus sp. CDB3 TaxID=360310 RepID=UPI0010080E00|nr:toll/interleukin-1 receptor domain-containing protein [Bacillus sp. CDB3]
MEKVFISYSTKDASIADMLCSKLTGAEIEYWFAPKDIPVGGVYSKHIVQGIQECSCVLLILSENARQSGHVENEVEAAVNYKKRIIPFRVDNSELGDFFEYHLKKVSWFDAAFGEIEEHADELIGRIKESLAYDNLDATVNESEFYYEMIPSDTSKEEGTNFSLNMSNKLFAIKDSEIDKVSNIYEQIANFNDCLQELKKNHILFLHNEQAVGKYTTAIAIANELNIERMCQFFPDIRWEKMTGRILKENTVFIIDHITYDSLQGLQDAVIKQMIDFLKNHNSYFIVTVNIDKEDINEDIQQYMKFCPIPNGKERIIKKHLALLNSMDSEIEGVNHFFKKNEIKHYLDLVFIPRDAEVFSEKLVCLLNGEIQEDDLLAVLRQNINERIEKLLHENSGVRKYTMLLALSVFSGMEYQFIGETAGRLRKMLEKELEIKDEVRVGSTLIMPVKQEIKQLGGILYHAQTYSHLGVLPTKFAKFKYEEDARAVLLESWKCYFTPELKNVFIKWLMDESMVSNKKKNQRILECLAVLCKEDYLFIYNMVISNWAGQKKYIYHMNVIQLFLLLLKDKDNIVLVSRVLRYWTSSNNYNFQKIAAKVYGTKMGIMMYPQALAGLKEIFNKSNTSLQDIALESFEHLYRLGESRTGYYGASFAFLRSWIQEETLSTNRKEKLLDLAISLICTLSPDTLVYLFTNDYIRSTSLVPIVSECLGNGETRIKTTKWIRNVFEELENREEVHQGLREFMKELFIVGGDRVETQMRIILERLVESGQHYIINPVILEIVAIQRGRKNDIY